MGLRRRCPKLILLCMTSVLCVCVHVLVEGRSLQKLSYINVSLPEPTKLGVDEVISCAVSRVS